MNVLQEESEVRPMRRPESPNNYPGSPEIIQELLDVSAPKPNQTHITFYYQTNSEWTNIQDIIKLTFKGIYHTLKVQNECIRDIEQILPVKANLSDIREEMNQQLY